MTSSGLHLNKSSLRRAKKFTLSCGQLNPNQIKTCDIINPSLLVSCGAFCYITKLMAPLKRLWYTNLITMHFDKCRITCNGKKVQVWKSTNFDAGWYEITTFSETCVFSI